MKPGDELRLRLGPYEHVLIVRGTSERRGPAPEAQRPIDAIRALTKAQSDAKTSIAKTDAAMGIGALHG